MTLYSWIAILTIVGISSTTFSLAKQPTSAINQPTVTGTTMKNGIEVACSGDPYCEAQPYIGKYIHMFKSLLGIKNRPSIPDIFLFFFFSIRMLPRGTRRKFTFKRKTMSVAAPRRHLQQNNTKRY